MFKSWRVLMRQAVSNIWSSSHCGYASENAEYGRSPSFAVYRSATRLFAYGRRTNGLSIPCAPRTNMAHVGNDNARGENDLYRSSIFFLILSTSGSASFFAHIASNRAASLAVPPPAPGPVPPPAPMPPVAPTALGQDPTFCACRGLEAVTTAN